MRRAVLVLATFILAGCQSAAEVPPSAALPEVAPLPAGPVAAEVSVPITPPASGVPAGFAAFSGRWTGVLEGASEAVLVVQSVDPNGRVSISYAWGMVGDNNPGVAAGEGRISGSTMIIRRLPNGADTRFTMRPDGTLAGSYTLVDQTYTGVFRKQ